MEYDELYHYGVLGMKWGIRRYQNKDGSLTSAGKKHYSSDTSTYVGDKKHLKRAKDAEEISRKISSIKSKGRSTERRDRKIEKLSKAREGLLKDLNEKEVRYGELYYKREDYLKNRNRILGFTAAGQGALTAVAANRLHKAIRELDKSSRSDRDELYKLSSEFRKNKKAYKQSQKEAKNSGK